MARDNAIQLNVKYDPKTYTSFYLPDSELIQYNFAVGNSMFLDDVWDFNGYVGNEHQSGARLQIKFDAWEHKPRMLWTVKWFMIHELTTGSFSTAKRIYDGLKRFLKFIDEYAPEIDSFQQITQYTMASYFSYLHDAKKHTSQGEELNQPLGGMGIKKAGQAIRDILIKGNVRKWEVPSDIRYLQSLYEEMIIGSKRVREGSKSKKTDNILPDKKIIDRILSLAEEDLQSTNHTFVLTAVSILITSQTGLRINEFITLKKGCIEVYDGQAFINHLDQKLTKEEGILKLKPANQLVIKAVSALEWISYPLREETGADYLFLTWKSGMQTKKDGSRSGKGEITLAGYASWGKNYLRPWIKHHEIKNAEGTLIDITSHGFRHAFATYAIQKGASMAFVSHMLGHESIRGTQHYIQITQEEVDKSFKEVWHEEAILVGKKALTIKEKLKENNPFRGKTQEQIKTLREAMKLQILSNGFCTHHPMTSKKPCEGDGMCLGCNNYLTAPIFMPIHEARLKRIREELSKAPENGPYEHKLRGIEAYLVDIISDLKQQIGQREEVV